MNEDNSLNELNSNEQNVENNIHEDNNGTEFTQNEEPAVMNQQQMEQEKVEPVAEPIPENKVEEPAPKKKGMGWIAIPVVLILLVAGLAGAYFLWFASPKQVFHKTIDKGFNTFTSYVKKLDTQYSSFKGEMNLQYEIKAEDSSLQKTLDLFNNLDIKLNYGMDYKNKIIALNLDTKYKKNDLVQADIYGEDSKIYVQLKDLMKKYVYMDVEEYDKIFNRDDIDTNDYVKIIDSLKAAVNKSIKDEKIEKTSATITINGKEEKVTKNYLVINNVAAVRISKTFLTTLKEDTDFIKTVAKVSEKEEKEILDKINSSLDNINKTELDKDDKTTVTISVYTSGLVNNFVGMEFAVVEEEEVYYDIIVTGKDNLWELKAIQGKETILTGSLKDNSKTSNDGSTFDEELNVKVKDVGTLKVNVTGNIKYNATVEKPDISNSVNYQNLTNDDITDIYNKISNNKTIVDFLAICRYIM